MVCILFPNFKFSTLCCSLYFENLLFQLHSKITVYKMKRTWLLQFCIVFLSSSWTRGTAEQQTFFETSLDLQIFFKNSCFSMWHIGYGVALGFWPLKYGLVLAKFWFRHWARRIAARGQPPGSHAQCMCMATWKWPQQRPTEPQMCFISCLSRFYLSTIWLLDTLVK
jgi:hypothetical protein